MFGTQDLVASTAFLEIRLERLRLADESGGWLDRGQYLKSVKGVGLDQLLEVLILEENEKKIKKVQEETSELIRSQDVGALEVPDRTRKCTLSVTAAALLPASGTACTATERLAPRGPERATFGAGARGAITARAGDHRH